MNTLWVYTCVCHIFQQELPRLLLRIRKNPRLPMGQRKPRSLDSQGSYPTRGFHPWVWCHGALSSEVFAYKTLPIAFPACWPFFHRALRHIWDWNPPPPPEYSSKHACFLGSNPCAVWSKGITSHSFTCCFSQCSARQSSKIQILCGTPWSRGQHMIPHCIFNFVCISLLSAENVAPNLFSFWEQVFVSYVNLIGWLEEGAGFPIG